MFTLGTLHKVELRNIWDTESGHFTPWLAQAENIELLSAAIGIDLEVEAQEKSVGPFRADILCKDTTTDSWVLIENQLERTDHTHLGQLLTYAAGLSAVTIVWIAEVFTEEHRAALDWLNEITEDRINFFGLEIELWRIGESPVAPKFNIVSKPNDWSKTVSEAAKRIGSVEVSETKQLQQEYWADLKTYLTEAKSKLRSQKPLPQHWTNFAIGRSHFHLAAVQNTREKRIGVLLVLSGPDAKVHFKLLKSEKAEIEGAALQVFEWRELPDKKESHVVLQFENAAPTNRADWPRQHEWLKQTLDLFHRVFAPRVKSLDALSHSARQDMAQTS
ncbi:MAG: DUF4268 domain-containing protein [Betaproteobacteria bacterium]|nr:DUF4268 domain-containing protein [Betaproteobacteria bacterium]